MNSLPRKFDNKQSLERVLALRGCKSLTEAVLKERQNPSKNHSPSETPRQVVRTAPKTEPVKRPATNYCSDPWKKIS